LDQAFGKLPAVFGAAQPVEVSPASLDQIIVLLANLIPIYTGSGVISVKLDQRILVAMADQPVGLIVHRSALVEFFDRLAAVVAAQGTAAGLDHQVGRIIKGGKHAFQIDRIDGAAVAVHELPDGLTVGEFADEFQVLFFHGTPLGRFFDPATLSDS